MPFLRDLQLTTRAQPSHERVAAETEMFADAAVWDLVARNERVDLVAADSEERRDLADVHHVVLDRSRCSHVISWRPRHAFVLRETLRDVAIFPSADATSSFPKLRCTLNSAITMPPTSRRRTPADTEGWPTRAQASSMLGVSVPTLLNWEKRGFLRRHQAPRRELGRGLRLICVYDPREIERLPRRTPKTVVLDPGEITARAFEMFRDGKTVPQVVVSLRKTANEIVALYEHWRDLGGPDLMITPSVKAELEIYVGRFVNVNDLVVRVRQLLSKPKKRALRR